MDEAMVMEPLIQWSSDDDDDDAGASTDVWGPGIRCRHRRSDGVDSESGSEPLSSSDGCDSHNSSDLYGHLEDVLLRELFGRSMLHWTRLTARLTLCVETYDLPSRRLGTDTFLAPSWDAVLPRHLRPLQRGAAPAEEPAGTHP